MNLELSQFIPLDVPSDKQPEYFKNYDALTQGTNRLMLFSCDQKIEHLNKDFHGPELEPEINNPVHLFKIASQGRIGAMATQLGLISRYGKQYPNINYIVKLNSKTDIISLKDKDPISSQLWSVSDIINFKEHSKLPICGVGYTIYLGSEYENIMLTQAAQIINQAHQNGLVTILWIYPRGKFVLNDRDISLISGAAGIANALGSDFVKINPPQKTVKFTSAELLKIATQAAGNTRVICAGGKATNTELFLEELYDQIRVGGTSGSATGRNIFQYPLSKAIAITNAISSIVYDNVDYKTAIKLLQT